jgi:RimJ/RimL family protein N-acetyltransferase
MSDEANLPPQESVEFRGVCGSDLSFLIRWAGELELASNTLGRRFPVQKDAVNQWIRESNTGEFPCRVAFILSSDGREQLGLVQLDRIDWISHAAWLGIWLTPGARGRGTGKLAVNWILNYGRTVLNLRQIRLLVRADNSRAVEIYRRAGFVDEGKMIDYEFRDGEYQNVYLLRKTLR